MPRAREYAGLLLGGALCFGLFSLYTSCANAPTGAHRLQADLAAHPGYQSAMQGLILHLSENNVPATWPGGSGGERNADTIIVSLPPSDRDDAGAALAERVYDKMTDARRQGGYEDQAGACFVHVLNAAGQEVAVDRMGKVQ